jgi:hypothetical protein
MSWDEYDAWHAKYIAAEVEPMTGVEARRHLDECLDEYARVKRALFLDGFADFVVKQGFGAVTPIKPYGSRRPESWQECGRRLWGEKHFNEALKRAIERRRGGKTSAPTSPSS